MMTKQKTRSVAGLKLLLILPLAGLLFFAFSCTQEEAEQLVQEESKIETEKAAPADNFKAAEEIKTEKMVFTVVEEMPTFDGGDINVFRSWVQKNVKYPEIAKENGIQGKVFVMFDVNTDGTVSDIDIIRGVDPSLDQEVERVVGSSPLKWTPGKQRGIDVPVRFTIAVNFQLQ